MFIQQFESKLRNSIEMTDQHLHSKKYSKYTKEMRLKLIKYVDQDKLSTAHAARLLEIKQTSACRIMKSYHKYNRIFEKKEVRSQRQPVYAEKQEDKGSISQNIASQQKKLQSPKIVTPNPTLIHQTQDQAKIFGNCQQNIQEEGAVDFSGKVSLLLQPVMGYNSEYYQVYYPNFCPLSFGFYV